ncbi:MAG: response regulator, partial [Desulfobacterales bacterium]|nr:response regulator [Desulfobacterales bacterium]
EMAPGNYVRISVSDTGCGISEQYFDKIFEPYFTTSETGTGTGLGLSVVHGIVKSHSGHITVYSEPGKGSTFHVYFPFAEQERSRDISTGQVDKELPTGTESILLAEDEKPIIDMQQQILETLGYHVTSRTSSVEALEVFRANPYKFDLLVTDITMPNMTGDRLALKVKEIRPDIPVILCTGFSEKINDQQRKELGIEGFLMKPVTKKDIAEAVRKVLDGNS